MKQRLCEYANCERQSTALTINDPSGTRARPAFCSKVHAALYLLGQVGHRKLAIKLEKDLGWGTKRPKPAYYAPFKVSKK